MLKTACTIFGALSITSTTMAVNLDSLADATTEAQGAHRYACHCSLKNDPSGMLTKVEKFYDMK